MSRWVWRIEHVWRIGQDHTRMETCINYGIREVSIVLFVFACFQTFCSLLVFYSTFWWFSGEGDQIRAKTSKN